MKTVTLADYQVTLLRDLIEARLEQVDRWEDEVQTDSLTHEGVKRELHNIAESLRNLLKGVLLELN